MNLVLPLALAAGIVTMFLAWDTTRINAAKEAGRNEVVQESKKTGATANVKSEDVRKRAAVPGSVDRLRKDPASCRDC